MSCCSPPDGPPPNTSRPLFYMRPTFSIKRKSFVVLRPFFYITWRTGILEMANFENKVPQCNLLKLRPSSRPCKLPKLRACEHSNTMAHFARVHYSPLCTGTFHTQVCGVCSCSSLLPWYVITPPTTGLAYHFNTGSFWSSKGKTFPFAVAPVKRGLTRREPGTLPQPTRRRRP